MKVVIACVILALMTFTSCKGRAAEIVDIEVVILIDSSSSMKDETVTAQRETYRNAFTSRNLFRAIQGNYHQKVAFQIIEFSNDVRVLVDWMIVSTPDDIQKMRDAVPAGRFLHGGTNLGKAVIFASDSILKNDIVSRRRTINITIDGTPDDFPKLDSFMETERRKQDNNFNVNFVPLDSPDYMKFLIREYGNRMTLGPRAFSAPFTHEDLERILIRTIEEELY